MESILEGGKDFQNCFSIASYKQIVPGIIEDMTIDEKGNIGNRLSRRYGKLKAAKPLLEA